MAVDANGGRAGLGRRWDSEWPLEAGESVGRVWEELVARGRPLPLCGSGTRRRGPQLQAWEGSLEPSEKDVRFTRGKSEGGRGGQRCQSGWAGGRGRESRRGSEPCWVHAPRRTVPRVTLDSEDGLGGSPFSQTSSWD